MGSCRAVWIGLLVVGLVVAGAPGFAGQATARVGVTIAPRVAVTTVKGLDFGTVSPEVAGSVTVSPEGTRTVSAGVELVGAADTQGAAEFKVTGQSGVTYSVGLPDEVTITCGSHSLTVSDFACTAPGNLSDGQDTLRVGATLAVAANQAPGCYAGSFDVVVNYD